MPQSLIPKILDSKIVAKDNSSYSKGDIIVNGEELNNLLYYFSFDGGDNLKQIIPVLSVGSTVATFPITNFANISIAGIKYKFIGLNAKVNKVQIGYSN